MSPMLLALKWLLRLAGVVLGLALVGGYLGAVHPLGDSLAVFRLWAAGGLLVIAILSIAARDRRWAAGCAVLSLLAAAPILWASREEPTGLGQADVAVYVKNLGSARADIQALLTGIDETEADVLLLQEVTRENADLLQARLTGHPHWHICSVSGWSGMAIASRWPISATACSSHRSLATALIDAPGGPIRAASVHQVWPFPYGQAEHLPEILQMLVTDDRRRIVAGDFNMVPWGHSVRRIVEVSGTTRIGPVQTTIRVRHVPLPIDHVLTNGAGEVLRRPQFGSDHYGLLARIAFAAVD